MMDENKYVVLVLGMHRSGTSCLTGCLERCGLHLGKVRRTGRFNRKGYYELKSLQDLHDQILKLSKGSWDDPPPQVNVHPYHFQQLKKVAHEMSMYQPYGLKDPRMLLLVDTWKNLTSPDYRVVGTFRHPLAVAQSLARRNGISEENGISLWLHYNDILIQQHRENPFPIIEFDLSCIEDYCRNVTAMGHLLNLSPKLSHLRYFVARDLEHHRVTDTQIPSVCRESYAYLQNHCLRSKNTSTNTHPIAKQLIHGLNHARGAIQEVAFSTTHR